MEQKNETLEVKLWGRLLKALQKKSNREGFETRYYIRMTLAQLVGLNLNDPSIQRAESKSKKERKKRIQVKETFLSKEDAEEFESF